MINEVIQEILDAEKQAEEIIREAHVQASQIVLNAHAEAETLKREYAARDKQRLKDVSFLAEKEGDVKAEAIIKEAKDSSEKLVAKARKNIERAVDKVADAVYKLK